MALAASDDDTPRSLWNLANAYRSQADVLKQPNKLQKSKCLSEEFLNHMNHL
jgi:hypothetical protein